MLLAPSNPISVRSNGQLVQSAAAAAPSTVCADTLCGWQPGGDSRPIAEKGASALCLPAYPEDSTVYQSPGPGGKARADLGGCAYATLGDRLGKPVNGVCDLNLDSVMESVI